MYPTRPRPSINLTALGALLMSGMAAYMPASFFASRSSPKARRPHPTMVVSPPAEIAAWNEAVRQKKLARLSRRIDARIQRLAPAP